MFFYCVHICVKGNLITKLNEFLNWVWYFPGDLLFFCCSVAQSCPALFDPIDCSTPGAPLLHCFLEFVQIHVHWGTIKHLILCCPLLLLPSVFSRIRVFFQWVGSLHQIAKVLGNFSFSIGPFKEYWGWFPLGLTVLISLSSRDCQESSPAPQFKSNNSLVLNLLYGWPLTSIRDYWETIAWTYGPLSTRSCLCFLIW